MGIQQPTIARRSLGIGLRKLREDAGLSRADMAATVGYSPQTIQRIEEGTQSTKHVLVKAICDAAGASSQQVSHLCGLAVDGSKPGWWQGYKDGTAPDFPVFLETEQEAIHIRSLETEFIPGLLQTPEYLAAVQEAQLPMPAETAEAVRGLRARRQGLIFDRKQPPKMQFIVGPAALTYLERRPAEVREPQLKRILEVSAMPTAEVRVIIDMHPAMLGSFNMLTPANEARPFVYIDAVDGCRYVEDPDVVSLYERAFRITWEAATPAEEYLK